MASYNEVSGRYITYEPEFYIPDRFRVQSKNNKQGSVFATDDNIDPSFLGAAEWDDSARLYVHEAIAYAFEMYVQLLDMGVAKEMARMILPLNLYTKFYMTVNARSLMNFLGLRAAEDAQWEIRQYAIAMKEMFKDTMPLTYKAWEENGYVAP
jgi:thymidylate synthase (FAD)